MIRLIQLERQHHHLTIDPDLLNAGQIRQPALL